jgi:pimeloyl-ACP methyl ester carboxylesterase
MRAIVWANQPSRWRRLLLLPIPGGEQTAYAFGKRLAVLKEIPTLVLWGGDDRVILARDAAIVRSANPNAEVHVARGIGHLLPLEAPAWVNGHITRFAAFRLKETRLNERSA